MRFMRSSNPVLRSVNADSVSLDSAVTYTNVAVRTILLILAAGAVGVYSFLQIQTAASLNVGLMIGALILGFISVIVGTRSVRLSPIFSLIYAVSEGYILGIVSGFYDTLYEGIIPTAIATTFIVLLITMLLYSSGIVKVSNKFASFLMIGLISVIVMSLIGMFLPFGGGFYYLIVFASALLSVLFLFFDFENIKRCVEGGIDRKYSWVLALGLMVTLVWVYIEVLRLLVIFGRRR